MKDLNIQKELYLYNLEEAFCLEDQNYVLWFHINRAEMWLTEFNRINKVN